MSIRLAYFCGILEALIIVSFVSFTAFSGGSKPIIFSNAFYFSALSCGLNIGAGHKWHSKSSTVPNLLKGLITPLFIILSLMLSVGTMSTVCHMGRTNDANSLVTGNVSLTSGLLRVSLSNATNNAAVEWFKAQTGIFCFTAAWNAFTLLVFGLEFYQMVRSDYTREDVSFFPKNLIEAIRNHDEKNEDGNKMDDYFSNRKPILYFLLLLMMACIMGELFVSMASLTTRVPIMSDIDSPNYLSILLSIISLHKLFSLKTIYKCGCNFTPILWFLRLYSLIFSTYSISVLASSGVRLLNPVYAMDDLKAAFGVNVGGYLFEENPQNGYYKGWFALLNTMSYAFFLASLILSYLVLFIGTQETFGAWLLKKLSKKKKVNPVASDA